MASTLEKKRDATDWVNMQMGHMIPVIIACMMLANTIKFEKPKWSILQAKKYIG